ncbi:MAG: N-acetyl-gamma-glutamyl-phosphate reductase [Phycisphaerae bacterium]|nr:N-acetyl-gamma-glutamyl-phosphate reductase [Phycisphaerae bacterium]
MPEHLRVAIVGATGYAALEAVRLLEQHPHAEVAMLCSRRDPQPLFSDIFSAMRGRCDLHCEPIDAAAIAKKAEVAMLCLPAGIAMELVPALLAAGVKVIDYSADYRLKSPADYQEWYVREHTDLEHLDEAVYGLPERFRSEIRTARLVANPGCYPTAAVLGAAPFVEAGLVDPQDIIVNAASGISGAGREPKQEHHFPERNENFEAYKVGEHRHMVEIERMLDGCAPKGRTNVLFVPHLVPMERGILTTTYLKPLQPVSVEHAAQTLAQAYADEPFVRLRSGMPCTRDVARTNLCDLTVRVAKGRLIVVSAIDNMVKGAAGQAIQNMNLMCGLDETAGLL